jgi:hypothetical protein
MEASGSSPFADLGPGRSHKALFVAGGVVGPRCQQYTVLVWVITITTTFTCRRRRQLQVCVLGRQPGQHIGFILVDAPACQVLMATVFLEVVVAIVQAVKVEVVMW